MNKSDKYILTTSFRLAIGLVVVTAISMLLLSFFPELDLRPILIPLWLIAMFFILKAVGMFIASWFSDEE